MMVLSGDNTAAGGLMQERKNKQNKVKPKKDVFCQKTPSKKTK